MDLPMERRDFLKMTAAGGALYAAGPGPAGIGLRPQGSPIISPGCRGSKLRVARVFLGSTHGLWPRPRLDFEAEMRRYRSAMAGMEELADVDFPLDELVTDATAARALQPRLAEVDGVLIIHLNLSIGEPLQEILAAERPTAVFAVPYSGHDWVRFGALRNEPVGALMECWLTSDLSRLAAALRPFRAIHHLREARILDLTTRDIAAYAGQVGERFGTEIIRIERRAVLDAYEAVSERRAEAETGRWLAEAEAVIEPSRDDVYRSCRLALAFEDLVNAMDATVLTIDCYGTMWDSTILLPAYPCLGFARLNNMGLGGICESDLESALTHVIFQGLTGRPGFISDPTVDESNNTIILAHCLGTPRMDGPAGPAAPFKLRTIMEREEGVVTQVGMRIGEHVTQARLTGFDTMLCFTGEIVDAPVGLEHDRGCRTKIAVRIDGDVRTLWHNWSSGLHRVTVYGDITDELSAFCRYTGLALVNEADPAA